MYRKYKGKFTPHGLRPFSAIDFLSDTDSLVSGSRPVSSMSLSHVELALDTTHGGQDDVTTCWRKIEQQCWRYEQNRMLHRQQDIVGNNENDWKTVRIFVSSTFTDFHNEREILVKKVFPALREWCESRKLYLIECDLRWGVPKDTSSHVTISTCMEELDRCHEETDGEPFFINMISDRYGWIPREDDLPDYLKQHYDWVPGVSITHMEVLHGAYRSRNPNAVFCLRNASYLEHMPAEKTRTFVDDDALTVQHLKVLKKKLTENVGSGQVFEYRCCFAGVDKSTGREKVILDGLDEFAAEVLEFFQRTLSRKYPDRHNIESLSQSDQEENVHMTVMATKSKFVRGRDKEIEILKKYTKHHAVNGLNGFKPLTDSEGSVATMDSQLLNLLEVQGGLETDLAPLCIMGVAGIGKSALVASFAKLAMMEGLNVLYHCVGCTSDSSSAPKILGRIIRYLRGKDHQDKSALPEDNATLYPLLKEQLDQWRATDKQFIIVIDGINEISDSQFSSSLAWLPVRFPDNIHCIVTVKSSDLASMSRMIHRQALEMKLLSLDVESSKDIVENYFLYFNKQLDSDQLQSLLCKESATIPLWLSLVCEELRVFGDFRMLNRKIEMLPEGLVPLLENIISRLIQENETGYIQKVLCLIYCSHDGIPESEVRRLLGDQETYAEIPLMTWATVRRHLKPFIHSVTCWYNGALKIQFLHEAFKQAVQKLLLRSEAEEIVWHQHLAEYYEHHCEDQTYMLEDMPYHLYKGKLWKRIVHYYRTDQRSIAGSPYYRQKYLNMIRCERHTPDMKNLSHPVKICHTCANKTGLLSPLPFQAKSACIVCGAWIVSHPSMETVARVCIKHCGKFGPTSNQCFFCDRFIQGMGGTSTPGLVCHMCTLGRNRQRCAKLLESDSL